MDAPSVKDKDILVRVHATTVNRTDCGYRAAKPFFLRLATGLTRPRRAILGTEGAHYAYSFIKTAGVRAGQDVLVHGASGAIGSAARR
ncbi:hypothetical protein ACFVH6_06625 [Spirillospora sp. NPDC127200]